jgi:hypothetical protein
MVMASTANQISSLIKPCQFHYTLSVLVVSFTECHIVNVDFMQKRNLVEKWHTMDHIGLFTVAKNEKEGMINLLKTKRGLI